MTKTITKTSAQMTETDPIAQFCHEHAFLYHAHGSGQWGASPYWTYYKVEHGDTLFSIEYFPVAHRVKIHVGANRYEGQVESLPHLWELLAAMRIDGQLRVTR